MSTVEIFYAKDNETPLHRWNHRFQDHLNFLMFDVYYGKLTCLHNFSTHGEGGGGGQFCGKSGKPSKRSRVCKIEPMFLICIIGTSVYVDFKGCLLNVDIFTPSVIWRLALERSRKNRG